MANQLYAKGKEAFLGGDLALDTDTIKLQLVDGVWLEVSRNITA